MPFEVISHYNLLRIQPSGTITPLCLNFMAGEVIELEQTMDHIANRITDLTKVDSFDISFESVWSLAYRRRNLHFPNSFRSAIVAVRPIELGFAFMFKTLNDNPNIDIGIHKTLEEALEWTSSSSIQTHAVPLA